MSGYSSGKFTIDQVGFIQLADTDVLAAVARGEIDLNQIAREELASRGLDDQGRWVGFDQARAALFSVSNSRVNGSTTRV